MAPPVDLVGRVAGFAGEVLRMLQTRLEMLGVELQRERDAIVLQLKLSIASIVAAGIAGLSAVLWAALSLAPGPRGWALGALTVTFVAIAVGAAIAARRLRERTPRFLDGVLDQLVRDRATLDPSTTMRIQEAPSGSARDALQAA
jgi:uncharacterized membrane protein YqjE